MPIIEKNNSILLKLLHFCNFKKEVFFKRSEVSNYISTKTNFEIPSKAGFDGNLSYFGYDFKESNDNKEIILLLRGNIINKLCLSGDINFDIQSEKTIINTKNNYIEFENEYQLLKKNKSIESRIFDIKKNILETKEIEITDIRISTNKKIYKKDDKFYFFPKVVLDPIKKSFYYEIYNTEKLLKIDPLFIIFPKFNIQSKDENWLNYTNTNIVKKFDEFFSNDYFRDSTKTFYYFIEKNNEIIPIYIEYDTSNHIMNLYNKNLYNLENKEITKNALEDNKINTNIIRNMCLTRDNNKCLLCDINLEDLLECSEIMPSKKSNESYSINNFLTLCKFHHALFINGYISFDENGKIIISKIIKHKKSQIIYTLLKNSKNSIYHILNKHTKKYLMYHKNNIFK